MKYFKKITIFLDSIPDGRKLSIRQQITLILWAMSIVLLPFLQFPFGVFQKLSFYPLLLIAILNVDKWWGLCWTNKYLRYTGFAVAAFIGWQIISLPFCIGVSNIVFAENIRPIINDTMTFGSWYVFLASAFFLPREKICKTFYWSFTIVFLYCGAYCIIELLHFAKVQWATDFLSRSIYYFIKDIGQNHGWWPPVFWDSPRLRSVYAEPSYFAVIVSFAELYFGFQAWKSKHWQQTAGNLLLMLWAAFLLCGTKSASGSLALTASTFVFIVLFLLFFRKTEKISRIKGIALAILLILCSGATIANQRGGGVQDWVKMFHAVKAAPAQQCEPQKQSLSSKQNAPKKQDFSSSSGTRLIHLKTELKLIAKNPVAGVGAGQYGKAMRQALLENPEKSGEIRLWSEKGDWYPPPLNTYTSILVRNGIIGLILFAALFFAPLACAVKCIKTMNAEDFIASLVLIGVTAVICLTTAINFCYYFYATFLIYCLMEKVISKEKEE